MTHGYMERARDGKVAFPRPKAPPLPLPEAIDLFCGLGGWTDGLLAEGWRVTGYDIEAHDYDGERYPAELVLADCLTLDGAQFADADLIVASPPCTGYSYMAMPWRRAKQIGRALRGEDEFPEGYTGSRSIEELNALFDACFRIQREASGAAGRHVPMVVENVRGAIPWVGRSRWKFGSFHLWGDVPALMPPPLGARKGSRTGHGWKHPDDPRHTPGLDFTRIAGEKVVAQNPARRLIHRRDDHSHTRRLANPDEHADGVNFSQTGPAWFDGRPRDKMLGALGPAAFGSGTVDRKAASARIAKIPLPLSRWIARHYRPPTEHTGDGEQAP